MLNFAKTPIYSEEFAKNFAIAIVILGAARLADVLEVAHMVMLHQGSADAVVGALLSDCLQYKKIGEMVSESVLTVVKTVQMDMQVARIVERRSAYVQQIREASVDGALASYCYYLYRLRHFQKVGQLEEDEYRFYRSLLESYEEVLGSELPSEMKLCLDSFTSFINEEDSREELGFLKKLFDL